MAPRPHYRAANVFCVTWSERSGPRWFLAGKSIAARDNPEVLFEPNREIANLSPIKSPVS